MTTPSIDQLRRAVNISEQIQNLEAQLALLLGNGTPTSRAASSIRTGAPGLGRKRRTMSPEAREKIAAAQRARWARAKGKASSQTVKAGTNKKKGGITPAGRAKLAAAMKARWAARRKGAAAPNAKR